MVGSRPDAPPAGALLTKVAGRAPGGQPLTTVYLETSAVLRMLFDEPGGKAVVEQLRAAERIVASRLVCVETERALLRLAVDRPRVETHLPEFHQSLRSLWARVDFLEITEAVCNLAGRIAPASRLRTLDAIHLATFHELRRVEPGLRMLTYDERLRREL